MIEVKTISPSTIPWSTILPSMLNACPVRWQAMHSLSDLSMRPPSVENRRMSFAGNDRTFLPSIPMTNPPNGSRPTDIS